MDVYSREVDGKRIWYAKLHYVDNGRRRTVRKSTGIRDDGTARSKLTAEGIGRDLESKIAAGGASAARSSKTLKQALDALIAKKELAEKSAATLEIVVEKSGRLFDHFTAERRMDGIDAEAVRKYAIAARKLRAIATVSRELLILREAFGAVGMTPPEFPDIGEPPPGKDRILELNEQRRLLAAVASKRRLAVQCLLQLGGIRKDEYNKLVEVDWEGRFAHIAGTKTKKSDRWVPIPDELFEELLPFRADWKGYNVDGWLPRWTNIDRDLRLAAKRAVIDPCSCNDLRRTYATFMARAGVSSLQLAKLMGTSERMLADVYARLEKRGDHMHEAVAKGVPNLRTKQPSSSKKRA